MNPSLAKGTKQPPHARQLSQPAIPLCAQACTLGMVQSHCHHTPQWTDWSREERRYMAIGQSDPDLRWIREHIRRGGDSMYDFIPRPWRVGGWPRRGSWNSSGRLRFCRRWACACCAAAVCRPRFERNRDCTQGLDRPQDSRLNYQSVNPPGATSDKINREEWDDEVAYPETALRVRASFGCATDQLGDADSDLRHRLTFRCCWEACSAIPPSKECWSCGPNPMDRIHHEAKLLLMAFIVAFALTTLVYVYGVDADAATVPCTADTL